MIFNTVIAGGGGGGGAGEWTNIPYEQTHTTMVACETDGTYVHVAGNANDASMSEIIIRDVVPANNMTADVKGEYGSKVGNAYVEARDGTYTYIYFDGGFSNIGIFSVVYPIAT